MKRDCAVRHGHDVSCSDEASEVVLETFDELPLGGDPGAFEALLDVRHLVAAEFRTIDRDADGGEGRAHR